jgi:hypothetical protein
MRRALLLACTTLLAAPPASATTNSDVSGLLVSAPALIREKQQIPDDPLAGLPTGKGDESGQRGRTGGRGVRSCKLDAAPADPREIGDLRATLAFVKRGPKAWPCPPRQGEGGGVRLRIAVDSSGKVTEVEPAGGDASTAAAVAKKLVGRTIAPRLDRPTFGTTVLSFTSGKR